jgi:glycosyltransferase involved in cell wall biosynthesis
MLLYVSRLAAVKFPLDVLRAFDLVEKKFYDSVLVIVGDGPLKASIRQLSEDLGISGKIIFLILKSQAELSELYASSDCIVFPHAGITLVEAALSAKPIVAYDYEWHPEVIGRDERGYLVPFRDYRAMAEKIEYVFNHYGEALGKASSARLFAIKEFNKDAIISLERSVFEKFLG